MTANSFQEYYQLREATEGGEDKSKGDTGISTKVTLGDNNDFEPFVISDDQHSEHYGKNKSLAPVVRAFKRGANWGWSKDDSSGEDKPVKISGRKLYLTGGAVRDHLVGKKPRNIELATNASPDEVYHILKQNEFEFCESEQKTKVGNCFWVEKTDKNKRPFSFGLSVEGDEFDLDIFTKTPKGDLGIDPESGTQAEDASGRDFTMNAMAILLSTDNGPNKELVDFHGGLHDLTSKRVSAIGNMDKKFSEDPSRLMRYVRMVSGYGNAENITQEEKDSIKKASSGLGKIDPEKIMDEFKKGIKKDDCNCRKYLSIFRDLGLLDSVFPGKMLDTDFPKELDELNDKMMPLAWMLRDNNPESLLDTGLDSDSTNKIGFLIKSLNLGEDTDADSLSDMLSGYQKSGVSGRKLKEWLSKIGGKEGGIADAFVNYAKGPRVRIYMSADDGSEKVNTQFEDLIDPFTGNFDSQTLEQRRRAVEYQNFLKEKQFMNPV